MASCRTQKASGGWSAPEQFEGCMSAKDYHLVAARKCRDDAYVVAPSALALREPDCWFWASSNWP
jgi:hypothetical protein